MNDFDRRWARTVINMTIALTIVLLAAAAVLDVTR